MDEIRRRQLRRGRTLVRRTDFGVDEGLSESGGDGEIESEGG